MNPCDAMLQDEALPFITYPVILGQDVAGIAEVIGATAASNFKVGGRVFGFTWNDGFQDYITLDHTLVAKIPDSLSFSEASVFPLCVTTSFLALFSKDYLGIPFPTLNSISTGKSIFILGGSNAIQLAKAADFEVFITCSSHSFDRYESNDLPE